MKLPVDVRYWHDADTGRWVAQFHVIGGEGAFLTSCDFESEDELISWCEFFIGRRQ